MTEYRLMTRDLYYKSILELDLEGLKYLRFKDRKGEDIEYFLIFTWKRYHIEVAKSFGRDPDDKDDEYSNTISSGYLTYEMINGTKTVVANRPPAEFRIGPASDDTEKLRYAFLAALSEEYHKQQETAILKG